MKKHHYKTHIEWTGNLGSGTSSYQDYSRKHLISVKDKQVILASSDPAFRGDKTLHNPEDLFLSSVASCHMLWYLHFCSVSGVVVLDYQDEAKGVMVENKDGSGQFIAVSLYPFVTVADESMIEKANELHHKANQFCFIANSINFKVTHHPNTKVKKIRLVT